MIYIAVCDDDKIVCAQIETILSVYAQKRCMKITTDVFYSGESLIQYIENGHRYDLIYLDIELGIMNGIEVGKKLRKEHKNYRTEIVFISGKDGYDRQLFSVQPLHFIEKPIAEACVVDDLELALERAETLCSYFSYQKGSDTYRTKINDIIYFEIQNRTIKMVTVKENILFYSSLTKVKHSVAQYQFLQIHRSYLINYHHADVLRYSEVVMSNGIVLPISKSYREKLRKLQISEKQR